MTAVSAEALRAALGEHAVALGATADGIPFARVRVEDLRTCVETVRSMLGHARFVDLTAVDRMRFEERFELQYLFYSMREHTWLRLKARSDGEAPSITSLVPAADWYEREVYDLFGISFEGHGDLRRLLLPEDWVGHPLRRDEPLGAEPVDFTVSRQAYGRE